MWNGKKIDFQTIYSAFGSCINYDIDIHFHVMFVLLSVFGVDLKVIVRSHIIKNKTEIETQWAK